MTDADFRQLEEKLGLKLPAAYRNIMGEFPDELHDWPPLSGEAENRRIEDFLMDVGEIVKRADRTIAIWWRESE